MNYTLFKPDGKPLRATMAKHGWLLDVSFEPRRAMPANPLLAHELTHVTKQGVSVRGWNLQERKVITGPAAPRIALPPAKPGYFIPEVDDEVLIVFQSATPQAAAVHFNPHEYSINKVNTSGQRNPSSNTGLVREGTFRITVKQKSNTLPLTLALTVAGDSQLSQAAQTVQIL